ncbi:hypothetical protein BRC81_02975 [Halobacteriales archaeon QS_1_68_20]|nr:MAG: hypothetical protein BRC81_02975 [Halobacteriales archaeon QS_1_68_20]
MQLDARFEADLQEALLDDAEHELVGKRNSLTHQAVQRAHETLRRVGRRLDYDVEPIIESLGEPEVVRTANRVEVRIGWEHEAAPHFEFGTSAHRIDGDPMLSFVWEAPPPEIAQQFQKEGDGYRVFFDSVFVAGIPEIRFVRDALNWLRREIS